jgi:hypothetical protein
VFCVAVAEEIAVSGEMAVGASVDWNAIEHYQACERWIFI